MKIRARTGAAVLATALLTGLVPAAAATTLTHQDGRSDLQRDADALRATGATGVLAEVQSERGRKAARAGVADLESGKPVPWGSYYRIGSDTKTFTATVVLQLVGEGKLELTDTVEQWLPGVVKGNGNDGRKVTVKNLLRHTSGLHNYTDILFGDPESLTPEAYYADRFRTQTPQEQVELAMSKQPSWIPDPDNPAEEKRWEYSNTNYVLAGMVIEKVTGRSWEQEIHERIVKPLGLRHTMTLGTSVYVPQPRATAYTQFPGRQELTDTTLAVGGGADGGIVSTTRDVGTFLRALLGGQLLRPAELKEMKRTVDAPDFYSPDDLPGVRYGLGIAWRPAGAGCEDGIWFHGGTSFGTISETGVTPDGGRAVAAVVPTLSFGDDRQKAQDKAGYRLVDNALCGDASR